MPLGQILGLSAAKAGSVVVAKLDAGDKVVIRSVFKEMEAGQLLTRHQVRTKLRSHKHLRQYVVDKKKVKKIADFLRYETNTVRQLHHLEDQGDDDAGSAVITLTSGSRRQWSTTSTEVVSNYFTTFQTMPHKMEVLRLFSEHPVLCHILKAEGPERCYDKVKNIFRKRSLK